jgi:hypothetical protein
VSLATLCRALATDINSVNGCPAVGTSQVGANVFSHEALIGSNWESIYPTFWNLLDFGKTTCRSIMITFGIPTKPDVEPGAAAYIEVVQETLDPQVATAAYGAIATLNASLDGRPWFIENAATVGEVGIAIRGQASCYSATGK